MSFAYLERGNKENPTIIFLHGFMGAKEDWLPLIEKLEGLYYCLCIDLPGHGESTKDQFIDIHHIASELNSFLKEKLPQKKLTLLGYSLGGRLAMSMVKDEEGLFHKIILESCNPGLETEEERSNRLKQDEELLNDVKTESDFKSFLNKWYKLPIFGNIKQHPDYQKLIQKKSKQNFNRFKSSLNFLSIGKQMNLWMDLANIKTPHLFISGELDQKYTLIGQRLNNEHQNFHHICLERLGHNTHFEDLDIFIETILKFLDQSKQD